MRVQRILLAALSIAGACDRGPFEAADADFSARVAPSSAVSRGEVVAENLTWQASGAVYPLATLHLEASAKIYVETDGYLVPAARGVLTAGSSIRVWTTGTELRSDPPQYYVRQIVLLR